MISALVVLPTYNERSNLERVVQEVFLASPECHILVVDDNSPDGTGVLADELAERFLGAMFVLHRPQKNGLGRAYSAAFSSRLVQGYSAVVQMDADMSHAPSSLPLFLQALCGNDLVLGTRYAGGIRVINWDFKRLLLSKAATTYAATLMGMPFSDVTSGFRAWNRDALNSIDWSRTISNGYLFQIESLFNAYRSKMRITELPITFYERQRGTSKIDLYIITEAFFGTAWLKVRKMFESW